MSTVTEGVEIGGSGYAEETSIEPKPVAKVPEQPEEAVEAAADEVLELTEDDEVVDEADTDEPEEAPKKKGLSAKERIKELNARLRETERALERERVKKELREEMGLSSDNKPATIDNTRVAPNPMDLDRYPLGALDDRYVEDKIQFGIEQALVSVQQRQLENAQKAEAERVATETLQKAESVVSKGAEIYEDFREVVWEAGMRGDYRLDEPTFQAITEAEHGAEIAYALASNKAEAARVAAMTPYQQVKYVASKDAEFAAKRVRLPKAGTPPAHTARGNSGKFSVDASDLNVSLSAISKELFR